MLSQTAEYALRAILHLAGHPDRARSVREIAADTGMPVAYLGKVMQVLSRTGLIRSQRGVRGGFSLSRLPQSLTLREVVQAFGPLPRIVGCPLGILSHNTHLCPLHRRLDNALEVMEQILQRTTVADLLQGEPPRSCCWRCRSLQTAAEHDGRVAEKSP